MTSTLYCNKTGKFQWERSVILIIPQLDKNDKKRFVMHKSRPSLYLFVVHYSNVSSWLEDGSLLLNNAPLIRSWLLIHKHQRKDYDQGLNSVFYLLWDHGLPSWHCWSSPFPHSPWPGRIPLYVPDSDLWKKEVGKSLVLNRRHLVEGFGPLKQDEVAFTLKMEWCPQGWQHEGGLHPPYPWLVFSLLFFRKETRIKESVIKLLHELRFKSGLCVKT